MTDQLAEARRPHIVDGEFQSDKYPTCPRGKVPISTKDPTAQDLLWQYAQRRRSVDAEFADDLEWALRKHGYSPRLDGEQMVEGGGWEAKFKAHTEAVQGFLAELMCVYDPCESGEMPVRDACAFLVKQATDDRQKFYDQETELARLRTEQSDRRTVLEEAAKVCDRIEAECERYDPKLNADRMLAAQDCAASIRALIDQPAEGDGG